MYRRNDSLYSIVYLKSHANCYTVKRNNITSKYYCPPISIFSLKGFPRNRQYSSHIFLKIIHFLSTRFYYMLE